MTGQPINGDSVAWLTQAKLLRALLPRGARTKYQVSHKQQVGGKLWKKTRKPAYVYKYKLAIVANDVSHPTHRSE